MADPSAIPIAIVTSVVSALVYAAIAYGKSYLKHPEALEWERLMRTAVQAVFVGVFLWFTGHGVTDATFADAVAWMESAGLNGLVDMIVLLLLRLRQPKKEPKKEETDAPT